MSHTIKAAMDRGELDEEEAYFILRFAGHYGYKEAIKRLAGRGAVSRFRRWVVWFGGWETTELGQWDRGLPAWNFERDVTPLSLFGHTFTHYRWGWNLKVGGGYLVHETRNGHLYWSPDGTPSHALVIELWQRKERT